MNRWRVFKTILICRVELIRQFLSVNTTGQKLLKEDGSKKVDERMFRSLIGSLLYLTASRPDIMFAVSLLSRFMHCPSEIHFQAAKRILRYVKETVDYGIHYTAKCPVKLLGFSDSDWAGSDEEMRSTSGGCFTIGSGVITWLSKKQSVVAQSTAEAELVAANKNANQAIWLRKIMADLKLQQEAPTPLLIDNKATIAIVKNPVMHERTKHFKLKYQAIKYFELEGEIVTQYCSTDEQVADIFTKALSAPVFEKLRKLLGVASLGFKEEC